MNVTIILCTYNRCEGLSKALQSVECLKLPRSDTWEILVVDNNSTDRTRTVVDEFQQRHPGQFRYVFEPRQGKSFALNTGIREARGDVLAFTDDDVTVEPTWLENLTAALRDGAWAGAGGRILPDRAFSPPPWIPMTERYPLGPLAIFDPGVAAGPIVESPFGNNMAFQRKMFEKYGGFRTDLGPGASNGALQVGEDSEFCHRLIAGGEKLWFEPSAVVYHAIPPERVQQSYFLKWWYNKGRAGIRTLGIPTDTQWFVGSIPLHMVRRLLVWSLRWMLAFEPGRRFGAKLNVWIKVGEINECWRLSREARQGLPSRSSST